MPDTTAPLPTEGRIHLRWPLIVIIVLLMLLVWSQGMPNLKQNTPCILALASVAALAPAAISYTEEMAHARYRAKGGAPPNAPGHVLTRAAANLPRLSYAAAVAWVTPKFVIKQIQAPVRVPGGSEPAGSLMNLIDEGHLFGGSKQRILPGLLADIGASEIVYAGPATGYAQIALAYVCKLIGKRARVFTDAAEFTYAPLPTIARRLGANIVYWSDTGPGKRLKVIQQRAEEYVKLRGRDAHLLPFGMHDATAIDLYAAAFSSLRDIVPSPPTRMWIVAGSGTIVTSLSRVFPACHFLIVQVGKKLWPDQLEGITHTLYVSPYLFTEDVKDSERPPYDTPLSYDAKLWPFVMQHGQPGDYVWNTAAGARNADAVMAELSRINTALAEASKEEVVLTDSTRRMSMPMFAQAMPQPREMFANLRRAANALPLGTEVRRNFTTDYIAADGLSNHYSEDVRMNCIVNRPPKLTMYDYWRQRKADIAREAYWRGGAHPSVLAWRDAMGALKCYECNTFNPLIVAATIRRYLLGTKSGEIKMLDPSMGWGDRLIGALAMGVGLYVGFDPNKRLEPVYPRISRDLGSADNVATFITDKFSYSAIPEVHAGTFDLVLTSPPFFDQEIYEGSEADVAAGYTAWLRDMYEPFLRDMGRAARIGGIVGVYIENTRVAPMADDTNRVLRAWVDGNAQLEFADTIFFQNDSIALNGLLHPGHPKTLWVYKKVAAEPQPRSGSAPTKAASCLPGPMSKHRASAPDAHPSKTAGGRGRGNTRQMIGHQPTADARQPSSTDARKTPVQCMYLTTIDQEWARLKTVDKMVATAVKFARKSSVSNPTNVGRAMVERLLLTLANRAAVICHTDPILNWPADMDEYAKDVAYQLKETTQDARDEHIAAMAALIRTFASESKVGHAPKASFTVAGSPKRDDALASGDAVFRIGDYERRISAERMSLLRGQATDEATTKMLLRYATIISGSQHWEAPIEYFRTLYALGCRFEGFSSPVNSQFLRPEFKGARLCTLFPDTDAPWHSIGGFFQTDFLTYSTPDNPPIVVVGPPYVDELILNIAIHIIDHCKRARDSSRGIRFIVTHSNSWDYSAGFKLMKESEFLRLDHVFARDAHYYMDDRGQRIVARFETRLFVLDTGMSELTNGEQAQLRALFPRP